MAADAAQLEALRKMVDRLDQHIGVLIQAIDELTEEVQWRNRQCADIGPTPERFVLTSMPADLRAEDWAVNLPAAYSTNPETGGFVDGFENRFQHRRSFHKHCSRRFADH